MVLNKKKFARFIVLLVISVFLVFSLFKVIVYSFTQLFTPPAELKQIMVEVQYGDTAWDIQKRLTPDGDIEKLLYHAEKANDRYSLDFLTPGETLIFYAEDNQ